MVENIFMGIPSVEEDVKAKLAEDLSKIRMMEAHESSLPVKLDERGVAEPTCLGAREYVIENSMLPIQVFTMPFGHQSPKRKGLCSF